MIPEHYLSDGDNNTRATATQMGLPTFLKFQRRQQVVKTVLRTILDRVLTEAQKTGRISKNLNIPQSYDLIFPAFDHEDNQELGTAVSYLMQGLTAARGQGWISNETAMQLLFQFCNLEVDVSEELARISRDQPSAHQGQPDHSSSESETQVTRSSAEDIS